MALMTRNFLTIDEMGGNRDIASEVLGYAQKGLQNQQLQENIRSSKMKNEADQQALDEQNRLRTERESIGNAFMTLNQPVVPAQNIESAAPVAEQIEPAQITPVPSPQITSQTIPPQGQILTPQKIEQYAAQPQVPTFAAPTMPAPMSAPAQPTSSPQATVQPAMAPQQPVMAPLTAAVGTAPSAVPPVTTSMPDIAGEQPAQSAQPQKFETREEASNFLKATPEINGIKNPLSDETNAQKIQAIHQLYKDGKIRGATAIQFIDTLVQQREKQVDRAIELQTKIQEIQSSDLSNQEKKIKLAAVVRGNDDNKYFEVYQSLKSQGVEQAKLTAQVLGVPEDIVSSANVKNLEIRARRSPDFREAQKAAAEQRKVDILEQKAETDARRADNRDANDQRRLDQNDRRLDIADRRAVAQEARANAVEARLASRGSNRVATNQNDDGTVSGIKVDKQGNRTLDPIVAKNVVSLSKQAEVGKRSLAQIDDLEKNKIIENAPSSVWGRGVAATQAWAGVSGETRNARDQFEQFKNGVLGVIESPLMKGAPSEADARRALSVLGDAGSSPQVKKEAVKNLKVAIQEAVQTHDEAVNQYDTETRKRLKGIGVNIDTKPQSANESAAKSTTPVSKWKVSVR